ncbi:MAG: protein translocase subunit SecD [Acidimicrobiia bacterium]|nr:protein translocase subunit SecD [Acidimicrobiia bacterium]
MSRRGALITLLTTLVVTIGLLVLTQVTDTTPRLGLDLQGGFAVVLEAPEGTDPAVIDQAVSIMRRRIEALGDVQEPEIAVVGDRTVEVQLPGVTDRDRALSAVGTTGQLEFRPVLAVSPVLGISPIFFTAPVDDGTTDGSTTTTTFGLSSTTTTTVAGATTSTTAATTTTTGAGGETTTTTTVPVDPWEGVVMPEGVTRCDVVDQPGCLDPDTGITVVPVPTLEAFLSTPDGIVYHTGPARVLGSDLEGAQAQFQGTTTGSLTGQWLVALDFTESGGEKFAEVTAELAGFPLGDVRRQFAIVLDGIVQSAPAVAAEVSPTTGITGGSAVITLGNAADQESEASNLAVVLKYGALPVAFEQSSVESVSATLGEDSLRAGLVAGFIGLALVAMAMVAYYRALGLLNIVGLGVSGALTLVIFSALGAWQGVTLTLAGVAGIIVGVGVSADSYVVYYERIKEEVHRGRSLASAVDFSFKQAIRTILTADTVSITGAILLFFLAVGSVKGFALALLITTVCDVLVAVFFTRPAVWLLAHTRFGDGGRFSIRGATGRPREATK